MPLGVCRYCGSLYHDSEDCQIRMAARRADKSDTRIVELEAEVASLKREVEEWQEHHLSRNLLDD